MKTEIFKSYEDFLNRNDKEINGVSEEFLKDNPDYEKENNTNVGCWNCRDCNSCRDCIDCRSCDNCNDCSSCSYCNSCNDCSYCSHCRSCSNCNHCNHCNHCNACNACHACSYCRSCSDRNSFSEKTGDYIIPLTPKIEDIHKKVFSAASAENALNMLSWHTCKTTHCRAGWVVHLAGQAGYEVEKHYGTCLAAQLIYRESGYEINACRFFDDEEEAMADMKRLAENEKI